MIETTEQIQQILKRWQNAKNKRSSWEGLCNAGMEYILNEHGSLKLKSSEITQGERRGNKAYDGTPESALDVLVFGLVSGLCPDNAKWFKWQLVPAWLNDLREVKAWLEECESVTYEVMQATNYTDSTAETFQQLAAFGTGCKLIVKDRDKIFRCDVLRLTDTCFIENEQGRVDTLFHEFSLSARNAYARWGDKCPDVVKNAINSNNHDSEHQYMRAILPRDDFDPKKRDNLNMQYASLWFYPSTKKLLEESGFDGFPASVPRWQKIPGEGPYGRGPGIKALQDMGVLNQQERSNLIGGHKMVEPPMAIPEDGFEKALNMNPKAVNRYVRNIITDPRMVMPLTTMTNLPFAVEMQERKAKAVRARFFVDAFLMFDQDNPQMTATEALERKQEKLTILGPMIGRQRHEHLDSDLDEIFRILDDEGYFPPPPDVVLEYGQRINTEYVSPMAMAQRRMDSDATLKVYQVAGVIAQATGRPDVLEVLDDDAAIRLVADRERAPVEILKSEEQVRQEREARKQAENEAVAMQQGMAAVQAAQQLGQISTNPAEPNAAVDVAKALGGGE